MNEWNKEFDNFLVLNSKTLIDNEAQNVKRVDCSDIDYPKTLDRRMLKKIKAHENKSKYCKILRVLKNAVAVFMAICTVSLFLCFSVEAVRMDVWNIISKKTESSISIYYETNADVPKVIEVFREPKIQPEGLIKKIMWQDERIQMIYYYENEDDLLDDYVIAFTQYVAENEGHVLASDSNVECDVIDVMINGTNAMILMRPNDKASLAWHDEEYVYALFFRNASIYEDYIIKMAESVK